MKIDIQEDIQTIRVRLQQVENEAAETKQLLDSLEAEASVLRRKLDLHTNQEIDRLRRHLTQLEVNNSNTISITEAVAVQPTREGFSIRGVDPPTVQNRAYNNTNNIISRTHNRGRKKTTVILKKEATTGLYDYNNTEIVVGDRVCLRTASTKSSPFSER